MKYEIVPIKQTLKIKDKKRRLPRNTISKKKKKESEEKNSNEHELHRNVN